MHTKMLVIAVGALLGLAPRAWSAEEELVVGTIRYLTAVREGTGRDSNRLGDLDGRTRVMMRPQAEDGRRWVRSASGLAGYVPERAVQAGEPLPEPPPEDAQAEAARPEPTPARPKQAVPAVNLRPVVFVSGPDMLAARTAHDPLFRVRAEELAASRSRAEAMAWTSLVVGAAAVLAGTFIETCEEVGGVRVCDDGNMNVVRVGLGTMVLGPLLGWATAPTRRDVVEAVDAWNARHPEEQLAVP